MIFTSNIQKLCSKLHCQKSFRLKHIYPLSACVASSRHLAKMSTLACSKELKISSHLDLFYQNLELTAKSRGSALSDLKQDEI